MYDGVNIREKGHGELVETQAGAGKLGRELGDVLLVGLELIDTCIVRLVGVGQATTSTGPMLAPPNLAKGALGMNGGAITGKINSRIHNLLQGMLEDLAWVRNIVGSSSVESHQR